MQNEIPTFSDIYFVPVTYKLLNFYLQTLQFKHFHCAIFSLAL